MNALSLFVLGTTLALLFGCVVVAYLRRPLEKLLVDLCGNHERAGFWTAFSAVALGLTPVIFAMEWGPNLAASSLLLSDFAGQLKWGLIGLLLALLALGWIIGRSIKRWEARLEAKQK